MLYDGNAQHLIKWASDLDHIGSRLEAAENGLPDPGSLDATKRDRYYTLWIKGQLSKPP
jgi:hypothetical protein